MSKLQDPLSRVNGVGDTQIFGAQYAMRIWVDPLKLASFQLTVADVVTAVQAQNAQVSAGQLGALPRAQGTDAQRDRVGAVPGCRAPISSPRSG